MCNQVVMTDHTEVHDSNVALTRGRKTINLLAPVFEAFLGSWGPRRRFGPHEGVPAFVPVSMKARIRC